MAKRIIMVLASIFCLMQMHAETYISDIKIGGGSETDRSVSYNNAANGGYTVIDYDLNKKVGGDYIFLSYKTTTDPTKAIADIIIIRGEKYGDDKYLTTPITVNGCNYYLAPHKGDSRDYGDLNRNAGGDYLYMFYTREGCRKVTGMAVNTTKSGSASGMDLNRGTSTDYPIYLHLTKSDNHTYADEAKTLCTTCNYAWAYYSTLSWVKVTPFKAYPFSIIESSITDQSSTTVGSKFVLEYGTPPTKLVDSAYRECSDLRKFTLPASLKSIGNFAFYKCADLKEVNIPNSVETIGESAFRECPSLESVTIPVSVDTIGESAFRECTSLKSATILNSAKKIGAWMFRDCTALENITISNSVKTIGEGAFYGCTFSSIVIPNSVETIGKEAFKQNWSLNNVTLSNSLTELSDGLFENCSALGNFTIPNSVESIGAKCFRQCFTLRNVTFPSSLTSIGHWAFNDCRNLKQVNLPDGLKTIGDKAFYQCVFSDIVIPNSVETIGYAAFKENQNLNKVILSNSLKGLSDGLFEDCTGLGTIAIPKSVKRIGQKCFQNCYELHDVTLPTSLTDIGKNAFAKCTKLTSITLPKSLTNIESYAFAYCNNLKTIYCESETPAKIGVNVFQGCPLDYVIYVPENAVETYKNADGWKFHKDHIMSIGNKELHESGYENVELAQGALYNRLLSINKRLDNISAFLMRSNAAAAPADVVEPAKKNAMESVISGTLTFSSLKSYSVVDVDHNNKVNKADITKIVDYVIGNNNDSKQAISTSDMNGLGEDLCAKFSKMASHLNLKGKIGGHEYVNMGLPSGLLWASCNLGTLNPTDSDSPRYAWGETETKDEYTQKNYAWCEDTITNITKYCVDRAFGVDDGKIDLDADDDVARKKWGGQWRMPTDNEWQELIDGCNWEIKDDGYGRVAYYIITSKVNGNKLTLPLKQAKGGDYYWSSSGLSSNCANAFRVGLFTSNNVTYHISAYLTPRARCESAMIRPVISYEETLEK